MFPEDLLIVKCLTEVAHREAEDGEFPVAEHVNHRAVKLIERLNRDRDALWDYMIGIIHGAMPVDSVQEALIIRWPVEYAERLEKLRKG